jgi:hypothetical protein
VMKQLITEQSLRSLILRQSINAFVFILILFVSRTTFAQSYEGVPVYKMGPHLCVKNLQDAKRIADTTEERLLFKGLSTSGGFYLFFVGKHSYTVFVQEPESGFFCTGKQYTGAVVGKLGTNS